MRRFSPLERLLMAMHNFWPVVFVTREKMEEIYPPPADEQPNFTGHVERLQDGSTVVSGSIKRWPVEAFEWAEAARARLKVEPVVDLTPPRRSKKRRRNWNENP